MASRALAVLCLLCGRTDAFVLTTGPRAASLRVAAEPEMVLAYKLAAVGVTAVVGGVMATKKLLPKKEDPNVAAFRSSLAGMDSLSGLAELKLERDGREGRTAGVWKEYVKQDGRKWYYNQETKIQTWNVPDEFKKLDEVAAAAAAANNARGC